MPALELVAAEVESWQTLLQRGHGLGRSPSPLRVRIHHIAVRAACIAMPRVPQPSIRPLAVARPVGSLPPLALQNCSRPRSARMQGIPPLADPPHETSPADATQMSARQHAISDVRACWAELRLRPVRNPPTRLL